MCAMRSCNGVGSGDRYDGCVRPSPERQLELLRARRVWADRAAPVGPMVEAAGREFTRLAKRLGGVGGAWAAVCPAALALKTTVVGVSRGVATIHVADAATRFELDRWLRSGGERELIKRCPTTLRKVKLVIAE